MITFIFGILTGWAMLILLAVGYYYFYEWQKRKFSNK